jgi:hypothetical protein
VDKGSETPLLRVDIFQEIAVEADRDEVMRQVFCRMFMAALSELNLLNNRLPITLEEAFQSRLPDLIFTCPGLQDCTPRCHSEVPHSRCFGDSHILCHIVKNHSLCVPPLTAAVTCRHPRRIGSDPLLHLLKRQSDRSRKESQSNES